MSDFEIFDEEVETITISIKKLKELAKEEKIKNIKKLTQEIMSQNSEILDKLDDLDVELEVFDDNED